MTLAIDELGPDDLDTWADCARALFPGEDRTALLDDIRAWSGDGLGRSRAWVAREGGAVLGYAEMSLRPYANGCDDRPVAFLEAIWVAPAARRRGVGRALVARLAEAARARGLRELGSDALLANRAAHRAHRGWGFEEAERVVHFRLGL